ncbi:uncharacterized protein LOC114520261 [Dendronephthya gigantea]|uniref:uncharacterized protein LOC114520261 n=1 Tax=Dendronephthya gigantea TaxID=151771 RepID=UPI00106B147B|nr:uncharacterized protein LOC114520261 [Dendronephthya gigantea]
MDSKYTPDRKYPATSRNFEGKRSEVDGKLSPSNRALEQDNNNIDGGQEKQKMKDGNNSKPSLDLPKWYNPSANGEDNKDLMCVVRQFCLDKPVTIGPMTYCHVKLC